MDAQGLHAMVCKKAPGKIARHHVFNDIIWRAFGAAGIPAVKEAGQTIWQTSRRANLNPMARWPFVSLERYSRQPSYVDRAATDAGTVADMAATRKTQKYSTLSSAYRLEPIAVENLGVFSSTTLNFISELGCRICVHTDVRETSYLFQRISIMLQRFNSVLLHDTLSVDLPDL